MSSRVININAGNGYKMYIQEGLLSQVGEILLELHPVCKVAIISDNNVAPLYASTVAISLEDQGFSTCEFAFPAGEESKTLETLGDILEFLACEEVTRTDVIIALGGGIVGDVASLAAGMYHRGIAHVQIPTTLLAAVDSSVGGKTAVNLSAGKNLAGMFKQPLAVICDPLCLETLSPRIFAAGAAEAIKTGIIGDPALFGFFVDAKARERIVDVIEHSVKVKAAIVEEDEFDTGARAVLNLGHTIGHAIELCSNYEIMHGEAVAIGMAAMSRVAVKKGVAEPGFDTMVRAALECNGLSTNIPFTANELFEAACRDKKRSANSLTIIMPHSIGNCSLDVISIDELRALIEDALAE